MDSFLTHVRHLSHVSQLPVSPHYFLTPGQTEGVSIIWLTPLLWRGKDRKIMNSSYASPGSNIHHFGSDWPTQGLHHHRYKPLPHLPGHHSFRETVQLPASWRLPTSLVSPVSVSSLSAWACSPPVNIIQKHRAVYAPGATINSWRQKWTVHTPASPSCDSTNLSQGPLDPSEGPPQNWAPVVHSCPLIALSHPGFLTFVSWSHPRFATLYSSLLLQAGFFSPISS